VFAGRVWFVDELSKARVAHVAGGVDGQDRLVNG
jgi:hypothetical protein